jgi:GntR family transcriptional regulator/MocR family aminotransferase
MPSATLFDVPHRAAQIPFLEIDERASRPLYEQIYDAIREHIIQRRLAPGARIASSRAMARELGVSRFTVVTAFESLQAEGYITATRRGGVFVAESLPDVSLRAKARQIARASGNVAAAAKSNSVPRALSLRGRTVSSITITGPRREDGEVRPFHPRRAPLDLFPVELWSRLVRRQWRTRRRQMLDYGHPAGLLGLREAIAAHIGATRGVECDAEQVIVTAGAQQAFNLVFSLLLDPGDAAWLEEPGYLDARAALMANGARIIPVAVDGEGIVVRAGISAAPKARLAYVSPSHQYPIGATMSATRRLELIRWATDGNAWIVEDDYDSYFRYRGRPLPALHRLEANMRATSGMSRDDNRVIYVGTFSKTMFPALRLGYCVVPRSLAATFANARAIADRNSSLVDQAALAAFIGEGYYDRHLRRVRAACLERYDAMHRAAQRHLDGVLTLTRMNAGTHVIGWLSADAPEAVDIARAADDAGIVVFPLSRYCMRRPARDALVLGYGGSTPRAIDHAMARLAEILNRRAGERRATSATGRARAPTSPTSR